MANIQSVKTKIQGLIDKANTKTGKGDTDLTTAVNRLISGYGSGESGTENGFEALRYFDVYIDAQNNEITIKAIHYDKIYEDTGSYDVTIPDTLCGFAVLLVGEE